MNMNQLLAYASGACLSAVPACRTYVRKVSQQKTKPGTGFEQVNLWVILGVLPHPKKQKNILITEPHPNPMVFAGIEDARDHDEGA